MVEIKHAPEEGEKKKGPMEDSIEGQKYRLLYSKSKVYVHPTAYARDNIPGFVALVKRVSAYFDSLWNRQVQLVANLGSFQSVVSSGMDT